MTRPDPAISCHECVDGGRARAIAGAQGIPIGPVVDMTCPRCGTLYLLARSAAASPLRPDAGPAAGNLAQGGPMKFYVSPNIHLVASLGALALAMTILVYPWVWPPPVPPLPPLRVTFYAPGEPPKVWHAKGHVGMEWGGCSFADRETGRPIRVSGNVVVVPE